MKNNNKVIEETYTISEAQFYNPSNLSAKDKKIVKDLHKEASIQKPQSILKGPCNAYTY